MLSPDEVIIRACGTYPTLYATSCKENTKIAVFDHIFNVIGNGLRSQAEFEQHISGKLPLKTRTLGTNLLNGTHEVWTACWSSTKDKYTPQHAEIIIPVGERPSQPTIPDNAWHAPDKQRDKVHLYPNFSAEYSLVYKAELQYWTREWIDAAIWYYQYAKSYFAKGYPGYYGAWPTDKAKQQLVITDYKKTIEGKYSDHAAVTKAYGHPFNGDYATFISTKWDKELARINTFIDDTIAKLQSVKQKELSLTDPVFSGLTTDYKHKWAQKHAEEEGKTTEQWIKDHAGEGKECVVHLTRMNVASNALTDAHNKLIKEYLSDEESTCVNDYVVLLTQFSCN